MKRLPKKNIRGDGQQLFTAFITNFCHLGIYYALLINSETYKGKLYVRNSVPREDSDSNRERLF